MRIRRNVFPFVMAAWSLGFAALASAQDFPGQWVGDEYMVVFHPMSDDGTRARWVFVDEADSVRRVIPSVLDAADLLGLCQSCGSSCESHWHGGALYTLADAKERDKDGTISRRHTFAKWQEGEWSVLASLRTSNTEMLDFVPCDDGRFIVISNETDLFDDKRQDRSPFCRVSVKEGREEAKMDVSIDHGQDGLRKYMSNPGCFKLALLSAIVLTEGRATLVNRRTGLYWVFSTETASLVRTGGMFEGVTPELIAAGGPHGGVVLCVNPEKSGTVLASALDEDQFLAEKEDIHSEAKALYAMYPDGSRDEEILALVQRRMEGIRDRSPRIVWYRIHPDTGRVEKLKEPPEGGASVRDGWKNDVWRPMADGSVRMGWDPFLLDELKERVSKWAPGAVGSPGAAGGADGGAAPEGEPHPAT